MKKVIGTIMCMSLILGNAMFANASKTGDVVAYTVYTDIIASINDYNIESYNINGYSAVVAEELRNYGFYVEWNEKERALYITRTSSNTVTSTYIAPEIPKSKIGQKAYSVLQTDIKTYINGTQVTSYNIGGKTIVYFDDLGCFGKINYSDAFRRLDLEINDGLNYKISAPQPYSRFAPSGLYFKINSADGLQIRWWATANTNKTIHYYTTTYYMFNAVGDFAHDRWGKNYFTCKTIGPIYNGETLTDYTSKYEAEVYSAPVNNVMLHSIFLEYSDGTSETIYYNYLGFEENGELIL